MKKISFTHLVRQAQLEHSPRVDVADQVLCAISGLSRQALDPYRPYVWIGILSAAAACVALAASFAMQSTGDSVGEMMTYVSWITQ